MTYRIPVEHQIEAETEEHWLGELAKAEAVLAAVNCPNIKALIKSEIEATMRDIEIRERDKLEAVKKTDAEP